MVCGSFSFIRSQKKLFKTLVFSFLTIFISVSFLNPAQAATVDDTTTSPNGVSLAYTHILPSAFVLPGGTIVFGTGVGMGFFNVGEVSTNLFYDLVGTYNVTLKLGIIGNQDLAIAPYATYESETIQSIDSVSGKETDVNATAIDPGLVVSYRMAQQITFHSGATFVLRSPSIAKDQLSQRTSYIKGTTVNQEFTFGLSQKVALSLGGSYDVAYDVTGAGLSFHFGGLQVGGHYYFNVQQGSFIPILGAGYVTTL